MSAIRQSRQFVVVLVVIFISAFPWACARHCAMHTATPRTPVAFVCDMQFTFVQPDTALTYASSSSQPTIPTITQFVPAHVVSLALIVVFQTVISIHTRWHVWHTAPLSPPPKSMRSFTHLCG